MGEGEGGGVELKDVIEITLQAVTVIVLLITW